MLDSGYWMLEFSSRIHYLASSIVVTRSAMNLKIYLKLRQKKIDRALDRYLPQESVKPTTIHKAMRYSLFAGGKRLRPILCLAAAEAAGGKIDNALPFACALECIHTYSLVHDDLPSMDNDDLRRGRPTCHKVFGDGIAVLAGDALLTIAFEIVSRAKPTRRYDMSILLREVAVAAGSRRLIAGQVADLEAEGHQTDREQLRYIHENKTAAILTTSESRPFCFRGCNAVARDRFGDLRLQDRRLGRRLVFDCRRQRRLREARSTCRSAASVLRATQFRMRS